MADDFDSELLGLVGSDDEGDDVDQTLAVESRSPSQEAKESVEKVEEAQSSRRGVAQKVKSRGRKRRQQESEEEDGEASPSEPESLDASGMEGQHDDADAMSRLDEDAPLFPLEGQFYDAADRRHILSLPEIEREEILADRAQQVTRRLQDLQLKKAFASSAATNKNKRKAAAADLEDGTRRSTRPKSDKRSALDDYRRAREEKDAARNRPDSVRERRDARSPSTASDRDADGESEVEWAEPSSESRRDEIPPELTDFERCRVGRSLFAKICFYPGFENVINGCFCRLSIGADRESGQPMYRMCQVKGFINGKAYHLEGSNGKKILNDQYALMTHGSAERPFPLSACSDGKFTSVEFDRFSEALRKDSIRTPSRKTLKSKQDSLYAFINLQFTEETLQQKFAKQRAVERKHDPVYQAKIKRDAISKRKTEAEENADLEEVAKCEGEMAALDNNSGAAHGIARLNISPAKGNHLTQDRLAQLNHKNRSRNVEEVRKALLEEKRKLFRDREAAKAKKEAQAKAQMEAEAKAKAAGTVKKAMGLQIPKGDMTDLFGESPATSRAVTPIPGLSRAATPGTPGRVGTPLNGVKARGPLGALKKKNLDDDIIGALDLDIDVEI